MSGETETWGGERGGRNGEEGTGKGTVCSLYKAPNPFFQHSGVVREVTSTAPHRLGESRVTPSVVPGDNPLFRERRRTRSASPMDEAAGWLGKLRGEPRSLLLAERGGPLLRSHEAGVLTAGSRGEGRSLEGTDGRGDCLTGGAPYNTNKIMKLDR